MEPSAVKKARHRCRRCGHCNEVLSYTAYRTHKLLYYNEAENAWQKDETRQSPTQDRVPQLDTNSDCAEYSAITKDYTNRILESAPTYVTHDQVEDQVQPEAAAASPPGGIQYNYI